MALIIKDRVKQTTGTKGTGALALTGLLGGFQPFSGVMSDGDTTYYAIHESGGTTNQWEIGFGTYTVAGNTLSRSVISSSNSDSPLDLVGSGTVFITYPADRSVIRNGESQLIAGASGIIFSDNSTFLSSSLNALKDAQITGTPASTNLLDFNVSTQSLSLGDGTSFPVSGNNVTSVGFGAGYNATTNGHTSIGYQANYAGGDYNASVGYQAGYGNAYDYLVNVG